ncbi:MAG: hypothetical protein Q8K32_07705 [Archangium sp.]|nr:hypothetical protein [Archangium sp.]
MHSPFSVFVVSAGFSLVAFGCLPAPCDPISPAPQALCHRADAGAIAPDASFVLEGEVFAQDAQCQVAVDGGQIDLIVTEGSCGTVPANGVRAATFPVRCTIPPLPAGSYVVNSLPPTQFDVPLAADAGVRGCR